MMTARYVGSVIQKTCPRSMRTSRRVPPPMAVTMARTTTPKRSSFFRPAARTPLTAKTATPARSMKYRVMGRGSWWWSRGSGR